MGFKLSIPAKQLAKELNDAAKKTKKAGVRALNKTATQSSNFAQRESRKIMNVKASRLKKAYKVIRAKQNQKTPRFEVRVKYIQFPLTHYNGYRQTKKGVSVTMRKDKGRKLYKHAFISTMSSGHRGAYFRKGKGRLPIKEIKGPNPQGIFDIKLSEVERMTGQTFDRLYDAELDFIWGKA